MIPWEVLGRARAHEGGELVLVRRGDELVIRVDGRELMSSRMHGSEEVLAELGCERAAGLRAPRVLVGGLGMGFTLAAALRRLPPDATVVLAELVPAVVEWNRGPLAELAGRPLADPRVSVELADVTAVLRRATVRFDAVLLDVDNGPAALTRKANQALYSPPGLELIRQDLRPSGVLAVWSAAPDQSFLSRLRRAGFAAQAFPAAARGGAGGPMHVIFVATLDGAALVGPSSPPAARRRRP